MQIKTKRVSHALCFISLLLYPALANAQSGTAAPEGQPREESTLGAGPASPESPAPAPALRPLAAPVLMPASPIPAALPSPPSVTSKFSATLYGFVEFDSILDSTQSFNDLAGNGTIVHGDSYAAKHDRVTFGARNSRLGFKLKGPESETIKSSAIAEMDFLGNQPQGSPSPAGSPAVSESSYFTSPTFRIRHMALKLETPYVDIQAGQYWQLFGWQSNFHPNSVDLQGLPGQVYSRAPQLRLSHTVKTDMVNVEIAVAAVRPTQRDSGLPDGQAGLRLTLNDWKGMRTAGGTGTSVDPLSIGVSGLARRFRLPIFAAAMPTDQTQTINGYGVSVDGFIPVVPATATNWDNALTLTGSYVKGQAIADQFTGLSGGVSLVSPAAPSGTTSSFISDLDNGLVIFDSNGQMHAIRWQAVIIGLQYYFPTSPFRMWVSGNYSHMNSSDIKNIVVGTTGSNVNSKIFDKSDFADGNLFVDATQSIRFGLEYAWSRQTYLDGIKGTNHRVQLSGFYIF